MLIIIVPRDEAEEEKAYFLQERLLHDPRYPEDMTISLLDVYGGQMREDAQHD